MRTSILTSSLLLLFIGTLLPSKNLTAIEPPILNCGPYVDSPISIYKKRKISITLEKTILTENNGVGHDWNNFLSVNKQVIKKGEKIILELPKMAPLKIEAHAIEEDKHHPDKGQSELEFTYSELIAIKKNRFEVEITVIENGGKRAGRIAKWKYFFVIAKEK